MVRPNQIIQREGSELTFLMFARSENQVSRRVVMLNFPGVYLRKVVLGDVAIGDLVTEVEKITEGTVNRYAVTLDTEVI